MAFPNTTFVSKVTLVATTWLQAVNDTLTGLISSTDASKGAGYVGFGGGLSYVTSTVGKALTDRGVCVTDAPYLATGDGATDDTAAIQAALNARAGKLVILPPGNYRVTTSLTVPLNTTVFAYGATITTANQITTVIMLGGGSWSGGTITGPSGAIYGATGYGIYVSGTRGANSAIAPIYVTCPLIQDVTISNFNFIGISLNYVQQGRLTGNKITGIGYAAIGGASCNDVTVDQNLIDTIGGVGSPDSYGIFIDRLEDTEVRDPRSTRCKIIGNRVFNVPLWEAIDTHGGTYFEISSNIIKGCKFGIAVVGSDIFAVNSLAAKNITVSNNQITGGSDGAAIVIAGATTGATVNEYASDILVTNNLINEGGRVNDVAEGAVRAYATRDLRIHNNTLREPWRLGINLIFENVGVSCSSNTVVDAKDTIATLPGCIAVTGNNNTGEVSANTLVFQNAAASTFVAVLGITISGGLTGLNLLVGPNTQVGGSLTRLVYNEGTTTGVNSATLFTQRGLETFTLTSGNASTVKSVVFSKVYPIIPKFVSATNAGAINPGGKTIAYKVSNITESGFDLTLYPYDLTTWSATASATFQWLATT